MTDAPVSSRYFGSRPTRPTASTAPTTPRRPHSTPPPTPRPPRNPRRVLLTETQAAKLLAVSPRTLQGWRLRGGGPKFVRLGRRIRYRLSDLDDFVERSLRRSTSDPGPDAA